MSRIIIACLSRVQTYFPHNSILYYTELKGLQRYIVTPHVWTKAAKSLQNKLSLQHARQFQTKPLDEQRNNNVHYVALTRTISTHVARQSDARETMRVRPPRAAHPLSRDKGCGAARCGATRRVRMDKLLSRGYSLRTSLLNNVTSLKARVLCTLITYQMIMTCRCAVTVATCLLFDVIEYRLAFNTYVICRL